jgi:hypothetical protein
MLMSRDVSWRTTWALLVSINSIIWFEYLMISLALISTILLSRRGSWNRRSGESAPDCWEVHTRQSSFLGPLGNNIGEFITRFHSRVGLNFKHISRDFLTSIFLQDHVNDIDFDYQEYARQRFEQYWQKKPAVLSLWINTWLQELPEGLCCT